MPALNVWADEENIYVESELPGLDASDVELFVTGRQLTLRGERKPPVVDKGVWHRQERPHGRFQRTLELPIDVDTAAVEAQFHNGVLLVKLPKHAEIRPRRVEIKVGSPQ
jgi:HSP20 family protein